MDRRTKAARSSDGILANIVSAWNDENGRHRDKLLDVGRMLMEFIRARLAEGDGLTEWSRRAQGISRRAATKWAATRMGTTRARVNALIRTAAVVDVLGGGRCNLGRVSHSTLHALHVCVERGARAKAMDSAVRAGSVPISEVDAWSVRADCPWALELFQRAVKDAMTEKQLYQVLCERGRARVKEDRAVAEKSAQANSPVRTKEGPRVAGASALASPPDLAEMICGMVRNSRDPEAVKALLMKALPEVRAPRPTLSFK